MVLYNFYQDSCHILLNVMSVYYCLLSSYYKTSSGQVCNIQFEQKAISTKILHSTKCVSGCLIALFAGIQTVIRSADNSGLEKTTEPPGNIKKLSDSNEISVRG